LKKSVASAIDTRDFWIESGNAFLAEVLLPLAVAASVMELTGCLFASRDRTQTSS
jgi:hypothetical protein